MGKQWKQWETLFWGGGSKITADGDCSQETKRHLLLGRKVMTNLDSLLKSGNITLPTNVCIVKAMVFPVVIYVCESWTIKKAEHWRTDALELLCWRRLLRVPWTARSSNQSILKEVNPKYSLKGLMLKLKLQYFGHLIRRADSFEKTLMRERLKTGGEVGNRGRDGWMASLTPWRWVWVNSWSWWWTGRPDVLCFPWGHEELDTTEQLNWIWKGPSNKSVSWYQKKSELRVPESFTMGSKHVFSLHLKYSDLIILSSKPTCHLPEGDIIPIF